MKRLFTSLFVAVLCCSIFAADLNPFAYNLKSEYNPNTLTLTVNFSLNAPATYMKLAISNGASDVWTKEYKGADYASGKVPKKDYQEVIDVSDLPAGVDLTWRVDVKGAAVSTPTFVKNDVRLYAPTSVDIDNNPENPNFGTVFCVEGLNGAYQKSGYTNYISYTDGAGLYVLNADGTARQMPFQTDKVRYGYNGGVVNKDISGNTDRTRPSFGGTSGYNAYRVRVSDDGRIFVTAFSTNGQVLWEAKKECFSATTKEEWSANTGWHKIMVAGNANTVMATEKRNCSHQDCGIYSLYQGNASTGAFIAGPNIGFDVRGSGDNLKLLMLAGCQQAIAHFTPAHFYCDEYDFKSTTTLWNTAPSRRVFAGHTDAVNIINAQGAQVQYDKNGNVWMCQHRSSTDASTLLRVNGTTGAIDYEETKTPYRRCGGVRFNNDFTQFIVASNENPGTGDKQGGGFTVYPVDASKGMPIWDQGTHVNTTSKTGVALMDFAWDYAGNLYIAADAATNGQRIAVYAMPHAADRVVSTPAAKKYAFSVNCQAGKQCTVTTICNPSEAGTITCSVGGNARAAGVLTLASCTELTVTATPDEGYKFINWTDGNGNVLSTNKAYSFYVTEDITLKANFEYATYTGIVWKNLFYGGEANDIAAESATHPKTNERLWRLLQVTYNNSVTTRLNADDHTNSNTTSRTIVNKKQLNVSGFLLVSEGTVNFFKSNTLFKWLGDYLVAHSQNGLGTTTRQSPWTYYPYMFINRTDTAINWATSNGKLVGDVSNYAFNGTNCASTNDNNRRWDSFIEYGKPKHWRPYWAEHACNLPQTMKYSDYMPTVVTWKRPDCPSGSIAGVTPSSWYKWNHPNYDASIKDVDYQKYFILAWRKGSPTAKEIVHHVYESNMELHASYVLKNIDENDRVDPNNHDASNDDVIKLMQNRHWVNLSTDPNVHPTHTLTVTRKLQAGEFNTICLPFGVDLAGLQDDNTYHHPLKDADAYEYAGTTTSTYNESGEPVVVLNFNKVTHLEPGKPYLIQMKNRNENLREDMTFSTVSCFTDLHPSQGGGLIFEPTINPTKIPAGSLILVAGNRLALTTQEGVLSGMRGYFRIDESDPILANDIMEQASAGRVYLSFKKPVTSSVPVAPEAEQQVAPKARKIMRDGNIYILRGDEVYTIGGLRVK